MKAFLKILKDESGRQIEGMILIGLAGIVLAIITPQIARFGLSNWLSLFIAIAVVFGLWVIIFFVPSLITESRERKRKGIHLWNLESGETLLDPAEVYSVYSLAFSPDGSMLAYCSSEHMICMEAATGKEPFEEDAYFGNHACIVFSRDGEILAINRRDNSTLLCRIANDIETFRFEGHESSVFCTAISSNSRLLASGSHDGTVRIWTVESDRPVKCLSGTDCGYTMAFSPDGKFLAMAGGEGFISVWEIATGQEITRLKGHKGGIHSVTFSPDGKLLASGGADGTIRIWDAASRNLRMKLKGNLGKTLAVAFSPDGRLLASGSETRW